MSAGDSFSVWHQHKAKTEGFDRRLRRYSVRQDGRKKVVDQVFDDLIDRRRGALQGSSAQARLAFAAAARRQARRTLSVTRDRQAFFVTLTPVHTCFTYEHALTFDWSELQAWAGRFFERMSFLGIVEVALYTAHPLPVGREAIYSFHVHLVVWGTKRCDIEAICGGINGQYRALLDGCPPAHFVPLNSVERVRSKILYMTKLPMNEYRGYSLKGDRTGAWKQRKREMRPGHAARVFRVLMAAEIDQLAFAGGEGTAFLREVALRARVQLKAREQRQLQRLDRAFGR